ncbi:MAG: peptidylprolyl isomerase, partial [Bacteroidota bacterium]
PALTRLLKDEIEEVRVAAAYAIGQIGDGEAESALINAYNNNDSTFQDQRFNATVLEAIGKCGDDASLRHLSTIRTFTRKDTSLLEGQAWGIYRYALRGKVSPEGTATMGRFLLKRGFPESVRLIAANYLMRAKGIRLDTLTQPLAARIFTEQDTRLRMALAIALGKSQSATGRDTLLQLLGRERDYRVKCNIIKALGNYDYKVIREPLIEALDDPNLHVANTAAQFMVDHGIGRDASFYWSKAKQRDSLHWQVRTNLYGAAIKHMPPNFTDYKEAMNREILRLIRLSNNQYEKAAAIRAMGQYHWNYRNVHQFAYASEEPVVRTVGVESLAAIARLPDLQNKFRGSTARVKKELIDFFIEAINKSDVAMVAVAAGALRTPQLEFRESVENIGFLDAALAKLTLPKDTETAKELQRTINYYRTGEAGNIPPPAFNHPIEWRRIKALSGQSGARIETSEGDIIITFLKDKAPVTVANFVQLAKEGFYKGKFVHRVVPNFVIQTGCPRGDGYGSLNYSIRSELPPFHYDKQGYVGMASAGNHTECTQWFITHSPTPHLDGNYTAFAKVEEGMDVVHRLQQGDVIRDVKVIEF